MHLIENPTIWFEKTAELFYEVLYAFDIYLF